MKKITFIFALLLSFPVFGGDAEVLAKVEGTFEGNLFNGSDMDPVITSFRLLDNGNLSGKYAMEEEEGIEVGVLKNFQVESPFSISMIWKD